MELPVSLEIHPQALQAGGKAFFTIGLGAKSEAPFARGKIPIAEDIDDARLYLQLLYSANGREQQLGDGDFDFVAASGAEISLRCRVPTTDRLDVTVRLSLIDKNRSYAPPRTLGEIKLDTLTVHDSQGAAPEPGRVIAYASAGVDSPADPVGALGQIALPTKQLILRITANGDFTFSRDFAAVPLEGVKLELRKSKFVDMLDKARVSLSATSELYDTSAPDKKGAPLVLDAEEGQKRTFELAEIGSRLYRRVLRHGLVAGVDNSHNRMLKQFQELKTGTLIRIEDSSRQFPLPWNIVFDRKLPATAKDFTDEDIEGFWGYRYRFEQAFTTQRVRVSGKAPKRRMCVYIDPTLGEKGPRSRSLQLVAAEHRLLFAPTSSLCKQCDIDLLPKTLEEEDKADPWGVLKHTIAGLPAHLLYFFCHGEGEHTVERGRYLPRDSQLRLTYSKKHRLAEEELQDWDEEFGLQFDPEPVVFLNCCESGALDPFGASGLVEAFGRYLNASTVVGCDWQVPGWFAHGFAERFLSELLGQSGKELGRILFETRRELLQRLNPFGLIYSVYGDSSVQVADLE